jgi:hypothetical protein
LKNSIALDQRNLRLHVVRLRPGHSGRINPFYTGSLFKLYAAYSGVNRGGGLYNGKRRAEYTHNNGDKDNYKLAFL